MNRKKMRQLIVLLIVSVSLSFSIVYTNVQNYDPILTPETGFRDTAEYIKIYKGNLDIGKVRSLRIMVPFLASKVPDLPRALFAHNNRLLLNPDLRIAIKFAVVNLFFLVGTCMALYLLQRGFGFNYFQAFLGVMLFLGSTTVVRSSGLPMPDTAFFFFFLLCLIAIQQNNCWFLLIAHILGVFAKELIFLSLPMILLALFPWRRKLILLSCLIPGVIVYVILLFKMGISQIGEQMTVNTLVNTDSNILNTLHINLIWLFNHIVSQIRNCFYFNINKLVKFSVSFGLVWIPAIYTLVYRNAPLLLRRWSWLIVIIIAGEMLYAGGGALDRNIFNAFPVVIPLASFGLSKWLTRASNRKFTNGLN